MQQSDPAEGSFAYCSALLKSGDEDRWLASRFASGVLRRRLLAAFAFHHEVARIPALVSEPPLGEIRLQWWREAVGEAASRERPRAHPVAEALAATGLAEDGALPRLLEMIDARARFLYDDPFGNVEDLADCFARTDGALASVLLPGLSPAEARAATDALTAYALAREGQSVAPALVGEIRTHAETLLNDAAAALGAMPGDAQISILHVSLARAYLRAPAPSPVAKRLRLFWAAAAGRPV